MSYKEIIQFEKNEFELFKTKKRRYYIKNFLKSLNILSFETNGFDILKPLTVKSKYRIMLCSSGQCRSNNPLHPIQKGDLLVYHVDYYGNGESYEYKSIADDPNWLLSLIRICDSGVNDYLYPYPQNRKWNTIPSIYPKHAGKVLDLYTALTQEEIDKLNPYNKIRLLEQEFRHLVKSYGIESEIEKSLFKHYL